MTRSPSLLPLPLSMVCTTWDPEERQHFSWQLHTMLSRWASKLAQKWVFFQRLAWAFSLAWVIFSCTKVPIKSIMMCYHMPGLWGSCEWFPLLVGIWPSLPSHLLLLPRPYGSPPHVCSFRAHISQWCEWHCIDLLIMSICPQISLLNVVMYFIGGLTISLCAAVVLVLAFEIPFTRVEKILVGWSHPQSLTSSQVDRLLAIVMGSAKEKQPAAQASSPTVTDSKMSDALSKSEDSIGKEDIESLKTQDSGQGSDQSQKSSE